MGGFGLKRNLSNFLPKIRNTCIDYFQFVIIKLYIGAYWEHNELSFLLQFKVITH